MRNKINKSATVALCVRTSRDSVPLVVETQRQSEPTGGEVTAPSQPPPARLFKPHVADFSASIAGSSDGILTEIVAGTALPIALGEVPKHPAVRRKQQPVDRAQAYRWALRGLKDPHGCRVRLETCRLPGGLVTTHEAIIRFLTAINGGAPAARPSGDTGRYAAARKRLAEKGVIR